MSANRLLAPMPQDMRFDLNMTLQDAQLAALDDNARFIVRRMVAEYYARGFDHGWIAGQNDAQTDRSIRRDADARETKS